jgi:hypothetical protein
MLETACQTGVANNESGMYVHRGRSAMSSTVEHTYIK